MEGDERNDVKVLTKKYDILRFWCENWKICSFDGMQADSPYLKVEFVFFITIHRAALYSVLSVRSHWY